jgi:hypothetical protein
MFYRFQAAWIPAGRILAPRDGGIHFTDEFGEEVVHDLAHEHSIAEVTRDVALGSVQGNGIDPSVEL